MNSLTRSLFPTFTTPSINDMRGALNDSSSSASSSEDEAIKSKTSSRRRRSVPILKTEIPDDLPEAAGILGRVSLLPASTIARINNVADNSNTLLGEAIMVPQELKEAISHLRKLTESLDTKVIPQSEVVAKSMIRVIEKLEVALTSLADEGMQARSAVKVVAEKAMTTMETIEDSAGMYVGLFLCIGATAYAYHHPTKTNVAVVVGLFAVVGFTNRRELAKIIKKILDSFGDPQNPIRPQGLNLPALDNLSTGLAALAIACLGATGTCKDITACIRNFMPVKFVMSTFVPKLIELFQKIINLFRCYVLRLPDIELMSSGDPDFDSLIEECHVVEAALANASHESTTSSYAEIKSLRDRLRVYLAKFGDKSSVINVQMKSLTAKLIEKFSTRIGILEAGNLDGRNIRQQPVAIGLLGGPHKFKTVLMDSLIAAIAAKTLSDHDFQRYLKDQSLFTYSYDPKAEFHDNYLPTMQFAKIDEMGATIADNAIQDPYARLVDLVNVSPLTLNAARVELKDLLKFQTKFIVLTSNAREAVGSYLKDMQAYQRRVTEYVPVPIKGYEVETTGHTIHDVWDVQVDSAKCARDGKQAYQVMEFVQITRGDKYQFGPYGDRISFTQLVDKIVDDMNSQKRHFERNCKVVPQICSEFRRPALDVNLNHGTVWDMDAKTIEGLRPQSFFYDMKLQSNSHWPEHDVLYKQIMRSTDPLYDDLVVEANQHFYCKLSKATMIDHLIYLAMKHEGISNESQFEGFAWRARKMYEERRRSTISERIQLNVKVAQAIFGNFFDRYPGLKVVLAVLGVCGVAAGLYFAFFRSKKEELKEKSEGKFLYESEASFDARAKSDWEIDKLDIESIRAMDAIYEKLFIKVGDSDGVGTEKDFVKSADDYFMKLDEKSKSVGVMINCFGAGTRYKEFLSEYVVKGSAIKYCAWNAASLDWICRDHSVDLAQTKGDQGFIGLHPREMLKTTTNVFAYSKLVTASLLTLASGIWIYQSCLKVDPKDDVCIPEFDMSAMEDPLVPNSYIRRPAKPLVTKSSLRPIPLVAAKAQSLSTLELKWKALCDNSLLSMRIVCPRLVEKAELAHVPFHIGFILMIGGRTGLLPRHYLRQFLIMARDYEWDGDVHLYNAKDELQTSFQHTEVDYSVRDTIQDIMAVNIGKGLAFKSRAKLFSDGAEVGTCVSGTLIKHGQGTVIAYREQMQVLDGSIAYKDEDETCIVEHPIIHHVTTIYGDCGSIIVSEGQNPRILGMHTAGDGVSGYGIGYLITTQMIKELTSKLKDPLNVIGNDYNFDATLNPQGFELKERIPRLIRMTKSKLAISPLVKDLGESERIPARLVPSRNSNGEWIDPLTSALEKYSKKVHHTIDEEVFEKTKFELFEWFDPRRQPRHVTVDTLTLDEAVTGGGRFPGLGPIPRGSSPGYPFCVNTPNIKQDIFGVGDFDPTRPAYKKYCEKLATMQSLLEAGVRISFPFRDFMKDEVRSKQKVADVQTRHISGGNLDLMWLFKVYCGAFINSIVVNRIHNGCCVGINPYGLEWTTMAMHLQKFPNGKTDDGDIQGFDCSLHERLLWLFYDVMESFYESVPQHKLARACLFWAIVNSEHVYDVWRVFWDGKLPSGALPTSHIGCISNIAINLYAKNRAMKIHDLHFKTQDHFQVFVFGDDSLKHMSEYFAPYLTPRDFAKYAAELGIVYTSAEKGKVLSDEFTRFEDLSFLKRKFRRVSRGGTHYDAPLELSVITDMVKWTTTDSSKALENIHSRVETSLVELSLHGRDVYNSYAPAIIKAYRKFFQRPLSRTQWESNYLFVNEIVQPYGTVGFHNLLVESVHDQMLSDWLPSARPKTSEMAMAERLSDKKCRLIQAYPQSGTTAVLSSRLSANGSNFRGTGVTLSYNSPADTNTNTNTTQAEAPLVEDASVFESTREMGSNKQMSLTSFVDTAEVVKTTARAPNYLPGALLNSASSGHDLSLADFFARPVLIKNGNLGVLDGPGTYLPFDIADLICTTQPWADKHKGALSIRCTVRLKLVINATPFQQGLYMLCYLPTFGGDAASPNGTAWLTSHRATKNQVSQLPRAELDLNCDSSCELEIPFNSAYPMLPLCYDSITGLGSLGYFFLYPYVGLTTVAASPYPSYNIYMSLHDVVLGSPAVPQSFRLGKTNRKGTASAQEQSSAGLGPIASSFRLTSEGLSTLAQVPLLSSVASTPAWVADILAKTATSLGWSRPINVAPTHRMQRNILPYHSNVDASDNSIKMSYSTKNEVGALSNYAGSARDEMSINFIKSIPAYIFTAPWTKGDATTTVLFTRSMTPAGQYNLTTEFLTSVRHHTPISFLAENFEYYRGGLVLTMKIVKTQFHTGRLLMAFSPTEGNGASIPLTWPLAPYVHKEIIDIAQTNEVTFEIPYVSTIPFRSTDASDLPRSSFGTLYLYVLDALQHPDTVPGTVSLVFEIAGARDLEFAVPKSSGMVPYLTASVQGPNIKANPCAAKSDMFSGMSMTDDDVTAAEYCIGEKITSLRQVGKIYVQKPKFNTFDITSSVGIVPFQVEAATPGVLAIRYPTLMPDFYSMMGCIYAASRGGTNHRIMRRSPPTTGNPAMLGMFIPFSSGPIAKTGPTVALNTVKLTNTLRTYADSVNEQALSLNAPQYGTTHARANIDCLEGGVINGSTITPLFLRTNPRYWLFTTTGDANVPRVYRCLADDADFGCFTSIPPVVYPDESTYPAD